LLIFAEMEEGELDNNSILSGRFSGAGSGSENEWSGDESASVIADRIRQQRNTRAYTEAGTNNERVTY
jgi:hypothetical protein